MSRVLVTGGAGFLGSHLCDRLLADGHDVTALDNFHTGRRSNVAHLMDDPRFRLLVHDVTEPLDVRADAIYNLASPASPRAYREVPIETVRANVLGSIHMLDLAHRIGCPILQASTSEVYGNPTVHPQPEGYCGTVNPIGPRACYDEGKRCAETLFFDYRRGKGVRIKVARIFNTYGPRMRPDDGRVVTSFLERARRDEPIEITGDGTQTRAFCYVTDMVDGLVRLMATPDDVTGPVNLGNPEEIAIGDLARTIVALLGSRSKVRFVPRPADDPDRRRPDIALAHRLLGWAPATPLRAGLLATIRAMVPPGDPEEDAAAADARR
jgi:UDP-glucuronate decarboxylase